MDHNLSCPVCGINFFICSSCYRCHKYCSLSCRKTGYERSQKKARKKYAISPEARADHCDRNKNYRVYGRQSPVVMDETSDESPNEVAFVKIDINYCLICKRRSEHENLELFAVAPD